MSPRKLLIEVVAVVLLAAPGVRAEEMPEASASSEGASSVASPEADRPMDAAAMPAAEDAAGAPDLALDADPGADEAVPASLDDSLSDDALAAVEPETPAADATSEPSGAAPPLGAIGYDSQGRRGRIHIVVRGDTLWDISNAYLGTPWVWPSIWKDNEEDIANPHLIHPGDHIWITPSEMRRVTPEEAARMLANQPIEQAPAAMDDEPEPMPEVVPELAESVDRGSYRVSARETAGVITPSQLEASASIVDSVPERVLMSQEDSVYIGLGESDVEPGDQFTIFRTHEKVYDPDTGRLLGYHVELLGWVEVTETYPETSLARIGMSTSEVEISDRLMPREPLPAEIPIQASPQDVEGKISFFPNKRVLMGYNDFVYLNRGALDGLEVGSPLVVYRPGHTASETTRGDQVHVPDAVIARMLVVRAEDQSATAVVTHSSTELKLGDRFRGAY